MKTENLESQNPEVTSKEFIGLLKKVFNDEIVQMLGSPTFINHFGVDKQRKSHVFETKSGKTFKRKAHWFKLNPKIKSLEIPASIVNGLADEIAEIRGLEEIKC